MKKPICKKCGEFRFVIDPKRTDLSFSFKMPFSLNAAYDTCTYTWKPKTIYLQCIDCGTPLRRSLDSYLKGQIEPIEVSLKITSKRKVVKDF